MKIKDIKSKIKYKINIIKLNLALSTSKKVKRRYYKNLAQSVFMELELMNSIGYPDSEESLYTLKEVYDDFTISCESLKNMGNPYKRYIDGSYWAQALNDVNSKEKENED